MILIGGVLVNEFFATAFNDDFRLTFIRKFTSGLYGKPRFVKFQTACDSLIAFYMSIQCMLGYYEDSKDLPSDKQLLYDSCMNAITLVRSWRDNIPVEVYSVVR